MAGPGRLGPACFPTFQPAEPDISINRVPAIFAACAPALLIGCATGPVAPEVPASLRPPEAQVLALEVPAAGVQIYECGASKADPARFEWTFKAPEAELFDTAGKKIGTHYGGPTWESNEGGKVVGEVKARDDGPDPNAIPWLLLAAKSSTGPGVFGRTLSVQRVRTVGGKAPAAGCTQAQAGSPVRVEYRATYYFYVARQ